MTELVQADASMFEGIHHRLLRPMDPSIPRETWQRLFHPPWPSAENRVGYALLDAGRPVGFAAYLCADRLVGDRVRRVCNFSTWVVEPAFRSQAMSLVMPLLKRRDVIATNLTSIPAVHAIFSRLGFRELESHVRVHWPPVGRPERDVRITLGGDIAPGLLTDSDREIHRTHGGCASTALIESPRGRCYLVFTLGRRRYLRSARVHHVGTRDGLAPGLRALQWALLRRHGALLVEYDRRLAVDVPGPFTDVALAVPRLIRDGAASPSTLSNAYSEQVLLNIM